MNAPLKLSKSSVTKLKLGDGDILVVKYDGLLNADSNHQLQEHLRRILAKAGRPDQPVLVIDKAFDLEVLSKAA